MKINEEELKEIFSEIKENNKLAFEKLYNKYNKLVYGIAFSILKNKQDSEDIVQIIFAKIYDIDKNKLPNDKQASWLYTMTKNESITLLRKRKDDLDIDSIYKIENSNNEIERIISQDSYNRLISNLKDKEKEIISLKILADLSFDEIANLLNEPASTIKWRYYKSINALKLLLSNLGIFIITFIIGIKTVFRRKCIKQEMVTEDSTEIEESLKQETNEESNKGFENTLDTDRVVEEEKQEVLIQEPEEVTNVNYVGIALLGLSTIFLVITIIFSFFYIKIKRRNRK